LFNRQGASIDLRLRLGMGPRGEQSMVERVIANQMPLPRHVA